MDVGSTHTVHTEYTPSANIAPHQKNALSRAFRRACMMCVRLRCARAFCLSSKNVDRFVFSYLHDRRHGRSLLLLLLNLAVPRRSGATFLLQVAVIAVVVAAIVVVVAFQDADGVEAASLKSCSHPS